MEEEKRLVSAEPSAAEREGGEERKERGKIMYGCICVCGYVRVCGCVNVSLTDPGGRRGWKRKTNKRAEGMSKWGKP